MSWPCPTCKKSNIVMIPVVSTLGVEYDLCPVCGHQTPERKLPPIRLNDPEEGAST